MKETKGRKTEERNTVCLFALTSLGFLSTLLFLVPFFASLLVSVSTSSSSTAFLAVASASSLLKE